MTKKEFLENLYQSLVGTLGKEESYSHIQYYDEYIESEKIKGISEEDVVKSLGNPRHIAKTILDSAGYTRNDYVESGETTDTKEKPKNSLLQKVKFWAIVLLVIFIVFVVLRFLFVVFIRVGLPIILIVLFYRFIKKLFT